MTANGDGNKRITVTEWGAPTNLVNVTEQAKLITNGITEWRTLDWAADLLVYEFRDIGTSTNPEDHFGLTDAAGNPKPALAAYTAALA